MKSLFEQFSGTYRKQNNYVIPNFEMPDIAKLEIGFYGQRHWRTANVAVSSEKVEKFICIW